MSTLLLMELRAVGSFPIGPHETHPSTDSEYSASCPSLEYLLSENLLEKLFTWSKITGR